MPDTEKLVPSFKTGPLAWTGLFCFWLPFAAFFIWLIAMTWLLFKAVAHEEAEARAAAADPAPADLAEEVVRLNAALREVTERLARLEGHPAPPVTGRVGGLDELGSR